MGTMRCIAVSFFLYVLSATAPAHAVVTTYFFDDRSDVMVLFKDGTQIDSCEENAVNCTLLVDLGNRSGGDVFGDFVNYTFIFEPVTGEVSDVRLPVS